MKKRKTNLSKRVANFLAFSLLTTSLLGQSNVPGLANRNIAWPAKTPSSQFVYPLPGFIGLGENTAQNQTGEDWVYDIKPYIINGIQTGYVVCGFTTAKNMWYTESHMTPPGLFWKDPVNDPNTPYNDLLTTPGNCDRRLVHDEWTSQYRSMVGMYDLNGNLSWCRGGNHSVGLNSILQTSDGGFISIGDNFGSSYRQNGVPYKFNPTSSSSPSMLSQLPVGFTAPGRIDHVIVSKYDSGGNEEWSYLYGPESFGPNPTLNQNIYLNHCSASGADIAYNPNTGGYTILGYSKTSSTGQPSALVINITAQGFIANPSTDIREITSSNGVITYSLSCNNNSECIIGARQTVSVAPAYPSAVMYKINQNNLQNSTNWNSNPIVSNSAGRYSIFQDSYLDNSGNAIITLMKLSSYNGGSGINYGEGFILKYNASGGLANSYSIGNIRAYDMRMGLTPTNDGGYALVTSKLSKDANGNEVIANISLSPWAAPVQNFNQQASLPNYPVNCSSGDLLSAVWNTDTYVAKFNANLGFEWQKQFDADDKLPENYPGDFKKQECMYRIASDQNGALVVVGNSSHNTDDYFAAKIFSDCQNKLTYNIKDVTDNIYEPTATEVWSTPKKVIGKVLIKSGRTLTISNTTVEFADSRRVGVNTRIVIEPGGKLVVTNSTLTSMQSCEQAMWDGIEVQGSPTLRQTPASNQGWVQFTNSFVKNAKEAVTTRSLSSSDNSSTDWSRTGGGIVNATNTEFTDNRRDFEFMAYQAYNTSNMPLNDLSSIRLCTFSTTTNFGDGGAQVNPAPHITMWKTRNIGLAGNTFKNLRPNVAAENKGIGISTIDAAFVIDMTCTGLATPSNPCPGPNVKTNFTDLYIGVLVSNGASNTSFTVKNAIFDNNLYGVRIGGAHYGNIYSNIFNIPNAKFAGLTKYAYGVYMDGAYGCDIQENTFSDNFTLLNGSQIGGLNMGIYIANADYASGGVKHYRNDFTNMDVSTQAAGQNNTLQIDCNRFYHPNAANYTDISAVAGILADQGNCGVPPLNLNPTLPQANEFSGSCNSSNRVQINSSTTNNWYYKTFSTTDVGISPSCIVGTGIYENCNQMYTYNRANSCPSSFATSGEVSKKMTANKTDREKTLDLIDGGESDIVAGIISSATDGNRLRDQLASYGPYLSEVSLNAVLSKSIASGQKTQILENNAPFTEKTRTGIYNSDLSDSDKNKLFALTGESSISMVKNLADFYTSENRLLENELLRIYINDNEVDKAYSYLVDNPSKEALASIIPLTLGVDNELTQTNINKLIEVSAKMASTQPKESQLIADYCQMFTQFMAIDSKEGGLFSMTEEQKSNLMKIANSQEVLAPIILNRMYFVSGNYPYVDAYDIQGNKSAQSGAKSIPFTTLPADEYQFALYPNPASSLLNFDFNLGYQTRKNVQILSITGQKILEIETPADLFELNTQLLSNGVYLVNVTFIEEKRNTELKRLIIQN